MREKKYTRLTLRERKQISEWIQKGETLSQIAHNIGRGKNTVIREVRLNGGRDKYNATEANDKQRKHIIETNIKRSETVKAKGMSNPYQSLCKRIDNLEMQLEIALDVIKELKNQGKR
jgi:IS30 family transposase